MFASTSDFEVCRASNSPTGYFRGSRNLLLLIVEDEGRKWAVQLQTGAGQFEYHEVTHDWREAGVTFIEPRIEVDIDSEFDPDYGTQPGDLLVSSNSIGVVAINGRGGLRDLHMTFALWGQTKGHGPAEQQSFVVGFRSWRIVGPGDTEASMLWETPTRTS